MMNFLICAAALLIGYLVGSISFPRIVTSLVSPGLDLKGTPVAVEGSDEKVHMHGVSATSVNVQLGAKYGCLSSFLDMLKVALPVAAFHFIFPELPADILAATGAILGHNWPIYYKFKGGYGQSAIFGSLAVIDWTTLPVTFVITAILYLIFRKVHISSVGGLILLLPWLWYREAGIFTFIYILICSAAYFIKVLPDYNATIAIENRIPSPTDGEKVES